MSLIFHVGQRVKQFRDGITKSDEISTRLHTLSDLAQATIRRFADIYSQQHKFGGAAGATNILQTYPGKMGVPSSLFTSMSSHREAQDVADKNFLPDELDDLLDRVVRIAMKPRSNSTHASQGGSSKKRKPESLDANGKSSVAKKARKEKTSRPARKSTSSTSAAAKSRRKSKDDDGWSSDGGAGGAVTTSSRRRSVRGTAKAEVSYIDNDSDDADMEMAEWDKPQEKDDGEDEAGESENEDVQEMDDDQEPAEDDEAEASEKEPTPPPAKKRGGKTAAAKGDAKKPEAKKPSTASLPSRRSSRRG
ncbi:Sister chromatid cohesion and DNA repair protein (BimD) [Penicillium mononematosum]|uniref:Sister chromatid cohesion and DNA repair protein (BimD) n=1 Tax=Penicillium mononematosum TaxID=268346 RepID=UPI002546DC70|nr:Sister chromatid cohesion and DNA repair protein (BimD) [Penicillium mononematosum]KAJ6184006.1 Sister chromatid cohesion and DNA repair protein (BimD) [Penicillium mononematosum]